MFELPIAGILQPVPDPNSPSIQHISQMYNISVSFKQRSRMYGATVIVRGSQNNTSAVKVSGVGHSRHCRYRNHRVLFLKDFKTNSFSGIFSLILHSGSHFYLFILKIFVCLFGCVGS